VIHLEGRTSIAAALAAGRRRIVELVTADDADEEKLRELLADARRRGVAVRSVSGAELEAIAHGRSHGGVVARCEPLPPTGETELLASVDATRRPDTPLLLLLDGIEDARNLAFTMRSAEALGASALLLRKHDLDFDETELSRASSGAFERLPFVRIDRESALLGELARRGVELVGCTANAKRTIFELDLRGPTLLAVGGEKRGLSGAVRAACTTFARIPTRSSSDGRSTGLDNAPSLSTSHAAAVVLAEALRQRETSR
jgi:23S rRNA (guanosine2251-2'-O)-methyltransferase